AADWHHQPVTETVDDFARLALDEEAALQQDRLRETLREQPRLETVARIRRRVPEPQALDRLRRDAALLQLLARARAGRRRELLAEVRRRDLVRLQQRFAQRAVPARLVGIAVGHLRQRHAEFLRQHSDGIGERDLLVQFEELEHVAADAAAEAVEEPFVRVDVERRRLLAVKRTEPLQRRPGTLQ